MNEELGSDERRSRRPSIEERVARRELVDAQGRDRYDTLLRHLRAGREVAIERRRRERWDWHPIAGRILLVAAVVAALYVLVTTAVSVWREYRVDAWTGPDATVTSGQRLEGCPNFIKLVSPVFPAWIRYDGSLYQRSEAIVPLGKSNIGTSYRETPYLLDDLRIYTVHLSGQNEPGSRIAVRNGEASAAEVYRRVEGCT